MIISKQNSLIKEVRSLLQKKFRDEYNKYFVEGTKIVQEAIDLNLKVLCVIGTEKGLSSVDAKGVKTEVVTEEVFSSISSEKTPQGVIAVIEKPLNQLVSSTTSAVLLDGVADPNNVGAIIRTAAASGYNTVYMTEECADPFSPKATRCSMSGVFRVTIVRAKIEELLSVISLPIYVADMGGENVFTHKSKKNVCLVIGNEGHGVSKALKDRADFIVSIPMQNGVESLNASVSAGLLMYALNQNKE